jgi:hypothetical protein
MIAHYHPASLALLLGFLIAGVILQVLAWL